MKEAVIKRKEAYVLALLGLFLIVFLQFLMGVPGLVLVSIFVLLTLILVFLLFVGTIKWKTLFYAFFLWLILEGILRKWVFPSYSTPIYFLKHIILAVPYFYIFSSGIRISRRHYPFFGLLLLYLLWGVLEAFNFRATTDFRVQFLGLITHFWFVPLIFLIPLVLDTEEKILEFFKIIAYISLPIFVLGIIQYYSPASSPINTYATSVQDQATAAVGQYVRITGVFSYITPYNSYLKISLMTILYLLLTANLGKFEKIIFGVTTALGITNLIMTGSRAPVFLFIGQALVFILLILLIKGRVRIKRRVFLRFVMVVPVLLFVILYTNTGRKAFTAFSERTKTTHDIMPRLKEIYTPFKFLPEAGLIGYGIGTAYQGSTALVTDWGNMPRAFEEEWERLVLELGLVGFVIITVLRVYLFVYSWKVFRRIKAHGLKFIALMVFLQQIPVFLGLNIVFSYLDNIFYWSLIGLLVAVDRIEKDNGTKGFGVPPG